MELGRNPEACWKCSQKLLDQHLLYNGLTSATGDLKIGTQAHKRFCLSPWKTKGIMNINKFRLLQIIATIFFLVLHSVSFSSTREYKPVPVNKLHQSLSQQLTGDLYAAKSHRAELLTAQRQAQGKSNDANKRTQIDSAAQAISRVPLFSKEATGSFCGNATDRLSIVTKELKSQFISGLSNPSGKAYASVPVGCVHG